MLFTILTSLFGVWWMVAAVAILYLMLSRPNRWILDVSPTFYKVPLPASEEKAYNRKALNIDSAETIHSQIQCPKSLTIDRTGNIYAGSLDGKLFRIRQDGNAEIISRFDDGKSRPLGIRYSKKNNKLYFVEANSGLYELNLNDNSRTCLLHIDDCRFLDGRPSKFFDDITIVEDDNDHNVTVYITDVSRKFPLSMWTYSYLEPDYGGRIVKFETKTQLATVVLENLCFPNGIEISRDKKSLLICELAKRRILKYDIAGEYSGRISILIDNLPGEPENIRQSTKSDTYWIGLALSRDYRHSTGCFVENYSTDPQLRKLILRTSHLYGRILTYLGELFKRDEWKSSGNNLTTGIALILNDFMSKPGMALEVDEDGNILLALRKKCDMNVVSEILELPLQDKSKRLLFIGSSGGPMKKILIDA